MACSTHFAGQNVSNMESYLVRVRLRLSGKSEREPLITMHLFKIPAVGDRIEVPFHSGGIWGELSHVWSPPQEQPEATHDVDAEQA